MATNTSIEWTDATWNPVRGCSRVSEGCRHCYAERVAYRFSGPGRPYEGLMQLDSAISRENARRKPLWNGQIRFVEEHLLDPLRWKKPRRIFVNSMSDLFHEGVTDAMRDRIFAVMALCPQHTFQVLTKRPERMLAYLTGSNIGGQILRHILRIEEQRKKPVYSRAALRCVVRDSRKPIPEFPWPLRNVWLGVSVENQKAADERIPLLLQTPAAKRFISAEPLLGSVNLGLPDPECNHPSLEGIDQNDGPNKIWRCGICKSFVKADHAVAALDWVIVGGESGPGARPMHPEWVRSLRDQCVAASVPFFFKQWGEWVKYIDRDNEDPDWRQDYSRIKDSRSFCFLNLAGGCGFHGDRLHVMQRIGKKAAGHLLDGEVWQQFPGRAA